MTRLQLARAAFVAVVLSAASAASAMPVAPPPAAAPINAGTAVGTASVTVFTPVTVTQTQGLDFGTITSGVAGSVLINPADGSRQVSGGVGAVAADRGAPGAFAVTGQNNAAINVSVDNAIVGFAGGITGFTKVGQLPAALSGTSASFMVGGVLNIPAKTPAGTYKGTYNVAVNYP